MEPALSLPTRQQQIHFITIGQYLVNPIRIKNSETSKLASCSLLGHRSQVTLELQLGDTLILRFSIHNVLAHRPLPPPSSHSNAVNYIPLQLEETQFFKLRDT
jgi:hypothetical protein